MKETLACGITRDVTVQVGRVRGRVADLAISKGHRGSYGLVIVTLKNGRRLILCGSRKVKVSA